MPTLIVEDIPGDVYELIQRQAQAGNRTVSEEAVRLLRKGLHPHEAPPNESITSPTSVAEVRQASSRLPTRSDFILDTGEMSAPFDLPRSGPGVPIPAQFGGERLPEPFSLLEDDKSNEV